MPEVPKTLSVGPLYSGQTNGDSPEDRQQSRFNLQQNYNFNDILANVSEEQLEEITHTLQVNMVSESTENLSSHSSTSNNNRDNCVNTQNNIPNTVTQSNANIVCGVVVVDERIAFNSQNNTLCQPLLKNSIILGSIVLNRNDYTCEELRRSFQTQLSSVWDSHQKFVFLTKDGYDFHKPFNYLSIHYLIIVFLFYKTINQILIYYILSESMSPFSSKFIQLLSIEM